MAYDKVMKEVGDFGIFQKVFICGFVMVSMVLAATAFWTQVFLLLVPPHRCKISHEDNMWFGSAASNFSEIASTNCHLNISDDDVYGKNVSDSTTCPYGWVYDYSEMYRSFPAQHNWVCHDSWKIYIAHTCYWIGSIAGYIVFGAISDRFGRKRSFLGCICLVAMANLATFFSNSFTTFVITRFVAAIGDVNFATCSFVWTIEYIGPDYRVIGLAVWATSYSIFSAIIPFIVYAVADWHYILSIGWGISVITLIATLFVPESASWLITRGRMDDAAKCIHRVAKINGKPHTLKQIKELLEEKDNSNTESKSLQNGEAKPADQDHMTFTETLIGLVRTPNMRKKTILLIIVWMIASLSYVGNSLEITNLPLPFRLSYAISGVAEVPANIICLLVLDRIGRRWANASFFIVGGVSGIIAGGIITNPTAIVILVTTMRLCNSANFDITFSLASELLPTVVRGRGVSITKICGGLANATAPFIFSLSELDKLLPVLVFGLLCVVGGVLTLFLPEPAGQPLPHTLEDGENFGKTQSFFYCPFLNRDKSPSQPVNNIELSAAENKAFDHSFDCETKVEGRRNNNLENAPRT